MPQEHFQENLDPDVSGALRRAVVALQDAGATLVSADIRDIAAVSFPVVLYEAKRALKAYLLHTGMNVTLAQLHGEIVSADVREIWTK